MTEKIFAKTSKKGFTKQTLLCYTICNLFSERNFCVMKKIFSLLLACVLAFSCAGMVFASAEEALPEGALEFQLSHVNYYSWGAYFDMVTYGEGRNCHNLGNGDYGCDWWIAIKVDNVDGVYTVTQIEGNGDAKSMAASADGFVMYLYSSNGNYPANFANAQLIQVGDVVYSHTFDWTTDVASEAALGNIVFVPAGTELPPVDEPSEEPETPSEEPEAPSEEPEIPVTGDAGILVFAVLAVVAVAGCAVAVKARD